MATVQQMKEENSKSIIKGVLDKLEDSVSRRESLSLDDIFGFSEAKHLIDEKKLEIVEEPKFIPYRVFMNHIDSFHGRHISNFLSEQVYGATQPLQEEDEEEIEEGQEEEYYNEEKEEENKVKVQKPVIKNNYEIIGSVQDPDYKLPEGIKETVTDTSDRESFFQKLVKCGAIVYDITNDPGQISEALWALKALQQHLDNMKHDTPKAYKNLKETRHFILISTMMTWALTKPIDPDEPELPFTEEDYRRRKPHPNFKEHIALEKEVIKTGNKHKDLYKTVVITTALTYGAEEDVLHFLFKMAWDNEPFLPVFASGQNMLPLVHIKDLASIVHNVLEKIPNKIKFIFALDIAVSTLKQIVKAISKVLGSGKIKKVPKEEAFLYPQVTQTIYDMLTVNLNMEPTLAVDMKWVSETVFVENVPQVVAEYKDARGLKALKIFVHGPPAVGKTILSKKLCEYYKVHYLSKDNVVDEAINKLKDTARQVKEKERAQEDKEEADEEEEEEEDELQENSEEMYELLEEVQTNMAENEGQLDDSYLMRFLKERLLSNPCQNQGYVLDGFPQVLEQARVLFENVEDDEETAEEEQDSEILFNKKIMPEFVLSLEASDELLCERVMDMTEQEIQASSYSEEKMISKLAEFRRNNTDETTILNYFDELEIHPMTFSPSDDKSHLLEDTTQTIIDQIGRPRNYGPTTEEIDEIMLKDEERKKEKKQEVERKEEEMKKRALEERMIKMEEWGTLMNTFKEEEEELLAVQGTPLRHYLMRYIFPVLTKGLMEVAKVRPSDPVDYLAEFLFRENPEGKMFQPDIVEAAQDLLEVIYKFQDTLMIQQELDQNILDDKPQELDQPILEDKPQELDQPILEDKPQELDQNILDDKPQELDQPILDDKPQELDQNILDDKPQELDQNILDDKPQENETN